MATKKKVGRPTKYTPELADSICLEISTSSKGIHKISENHGVTVSMIMRYLGEYEYFREQYARAKELQAEFMVAEIIDICDAVDNDSIQTEFGLIPNGEWISRSRLRVDARKWLASKLAPKKYGDKLEVEHTGETTVKTINIQSAIGNQPKDK